MPDQPDRQNTDQQSTEEKIRRYNETHNIKHPIDPDPLNPTGDQGTQEIYSNYGVHGVNDAPDLLSDEDPFGDQDASQDDYGAQDQFGDIDGQDPYDNLSDVGPEATPGGEGTQDPEGILYGLAEPLAKEGDVSNEASESDTYGTRGSQDQHAYQQHEGT